MFEMMVYVMQLILGGPFIHWAWVESQFLLNKDLGAWSRGQLMPGHQIFEGCLWSYDLTRLWELLIPLVKSHLQDQDLESYVSANCISNQWISYMWNGTTSLPCWNHAGDIYWCNQGWPSHLDSDWSLSGWFSNDTFCWLWHYDSIVLTWMLQHCIYHSIYQCQLRQRYNKGQKTDYHILVIAPSKYQIMILPPVESMMTVGLVKNNSSSGGNLERGIFSCFSFQLNSSFSKASLYLTISILRWTVSWPVNQNIWKRGKVRKTY